MAASVLDTVVGFFLTVNEDPGGAPAGLTPVSVFDDFNVTLPLTTLSTPPVAKLLCYLTIFGSPIDIDLTAAQGTNGNVNCSGKKLIAWMVDNRAAISGAVTVAAGPSNGYTMDGKVFAKGECGLLLPLASGIVVDGTHKVIRVSGTAGDTPKIAALFG